MAAATADRWQTAIKQQVAGSLVPAVDASGTDPHPLTLAGPTREVKKALESYWAGTTDASSLLEATAAVEAQAWRAQAAAGIDRVGLDGTLYDHVLDAIFQLGLVPPRFQVGAGLGGG